MKPFNDFPTDGRDGCKLIAADGGQYSGQIQVIFGPMFSGKTTELIRRLKRYQFGNRSCLIVKYANDLRYEAESISTHDRMTLSAVAAHQLSNLQEVAEPYNVIGIDEGQFFPDLIQFCETMANRGKIIIVAALDATYQRVPFNDVLNLIPLAESVVKLNAVCMKCFSEASFTERTSSEMETEVIGGPEKYTALCRKCYFNGRSGEVLDNQKSQPLVEHSKENIALKA